MLPNKKVSIVDRVEDGFIFLEGSNRPYLRPQLDYVLTIEEAYKIMEQGAVGYTLERYNEACGVVREALSDYDKLKKNIDYYFKIKNTIDKYERLNKKDKIPNELWVKFRHIKKEIMKYVKVGKEE